MSANLGVSLSSLLLVLLLCVARAHVPSGNLGKDGEALPMSREEAALADNFGAGKYMDVVGSSTPVRANTDFENEGSFSEKLWAML